jgi:predicted permease
VSTFFNDFKFAIRQLRKSPGFTTIVVLTLALGVGANTAIFSIVNTTFLAALPYGDSGRLVFVAERNAQGNSIEISYPNFLDWHKQQDVFSGLAVIHSAQGRLKIEQQTEIVALRHVSADFFKVLGVLPAFGRIMRPDDDLPQAKRVAWITHEAWQRLFQGDPGLVNRSLVLDNHTITIAGILPADFRFYRQADLFTAIAPVAEENFLTMRGSHSNTQAVARLQAGVSLAGAQAQMEIIAQRLAEAYPEVNKGIGIMVVTLREKLAGGRHTQLLLLLGAVGLVLIIACVNVAHMLLARSFAREREMAIRTSLGASQSRLLGQLLVESLLLSVLGSTVGVVVGLWGSSFANRLVPYQVQRLVESNGHDSTMLLFVVGITLVTGLAFGLAPAWQLSHVRPIQALKQSTRKGIKLFGRLGLSDLLVTGQITLSLVLLIGAGLMIRSLHRLLQVDPGYEPTHVLTLEVGAPAVEQFYRDPHSYTRYFERVLPPVQNLAGVEAAAIATCLPFSYSTSGTEIYRDDRPHPRAGEFPYASQHTVAGDYFRAMGIPLQRGRVFDGTEHPYVIPKGVDVAPENFPVIFKDVVLFGIISQKMADRFWPGEDPIGKRFGMDRPQVGFPRVEIIGVVGNTVQNGLDQGEQTEFYLSLNQWPVPENMYLAVRTQQAPTAMVKSVRSAVASVIRDEPIRAFHVLADRIDHSTAGRRFNRNLFSVFSGTALILAVIGLYGVLAFNVSRRTREIGIRMALGAHRGHVIHGVVKRGLILVIPGLILGLACAWTLGRILESQLFNIAGTDPITYALGALLMLGTALVACLIPAWRAARIDPMVALRYE